MNDEEIKDDPVQIMLELRPMARLPGLPPRQKAALQGAIRLLAGLAIERILSEKPLENDGSGG